MGNFFSSLFSSSKPVSPEEEKEKEDQRNFDMFKYDGIRAQQIGQTVYAIKCFEQALALQEDFETMTYLASSYVSHDDLDEAAELLDKMVELEPDHLETLFSRAHVALMRDNYETTINDCQHIVELDEKNYAAWHLMGRAHKAANDGLQAIGDLTRAIAVKDDFTDAYLLRAEVLYNMDQPNEALPDADKAISLAPDEEASYLLRGKIYEKLGDTENAHADYQKTCELNPFNEDAIVLEGRLLMSENKLDEAVSFFDDMIDTNPNVGKYFAERGRAKNLKGDKTGAMEDLKKSIELNPEGEEAKRLNGQQASFDNLYDNSIFNL